jgi:hypothetical protein
MTGDDHRGLGVVLTVEPQFSLAAGLVRSVTGEAGVGENRSNLAVEVDGLFGAQRHWP